MLTTCFAFMTMFANAETVGGLCGIEGDQMVSWELNLDLGLLTISGEGAMADYEDPSEAPWYSYSKSIVHLIVEDGITHISQAGFQCMPYLESAEIAETVTSIGDNAFQGTALNKIVPKDWVGDIDTNLLPDGLKRIGFYAFAETQLENITLPTSLEAIGAAAFAYNDKLQEVNSLATTPPEADRAVFFECNKLWAIYVPDSQVETYNATAGWATYTALIVPVSGRTELFDANPEEKTYGLPEGMLVTDLGMTSALVICSLPEGAIAWNLHYRQQTADNESEMRWVSVDNLTTRSYTIENLKPATNYVVRLQAVYSEDEVGGWTRSLPFTTASENTERENKQELAFLEYKAIKKIECDDMAMPEIDDKHCTLLIDQAKQAIDALAFDENKSLEENLAALDAITSQLAIDLAIHRGSITGLGDSIIQYTSTEKLLRFEEIQYFIGAKGVIMHDWNAETGEGTVVYDGTVTELGSYCLQFTSALTGIVIPEGVTKIGFQAFKGCSKMTTIKLPRTLQEIGGISGLAFEGCSGLANGKFIIDDIAWWCGLVIKGCYSNPLFYARHIYSDEDTEITDLVIPEGVIKICDNAFYRCEGIKSVKFPSSLTSIGSNAFCESGLESVVIPEGITEIEESTFNRCANLKSATIPEGVETIGGSAFCHTGLTSLTLPSTIRSMSQSFYNCENLTSLTLTDGITTLGRSFYSCTALTSVNIPGSIKEIDSSDFSRCSSLTKVTLNEGTEKVNFSTCDLLATINFPSTIKEIYFYSCPSIETVTLQEGVERIGSFEGCNGLQQINIPSTVTFIGSFKACDNLKKVIVADIASWCAARHYDSRYYGPQKQAGKLYLGTVDKHEEIIDLVIPEGVTKITGEAFLGLPNITTITLPSTLTTMEYKIFQDCTGVTDVYCYADPATLSWSESQNNFKDEKATLFHVADVDAWMAKFPEANVTYVGDLPASVKTILSRNNLDVNVIYNLSGQRVDKSYKGIVIINGQKQIIK